MPGLRAEISTVTTFEVKQTMILILMDFKMAAYFNFMPFKSCLTRIVTAKKKSREKWPGSVPVDIHESDVQLTFQLFLNYFHIYNIYLLLFSYVNSVVFVKGKDPSHVP